jgi:Domain of unknown function DUF29
MAAALPTIPVDDEVAQLYHASDPQTQQDIQRELKDILKNLMAAHDNIAHTLHRALLAYDQDFYAWTQQTAALIRAEHWSAIDREALAEEVEDLGVSQYHAVSSDLYQVLIHLLKWRYQPRGRAEGHSWQDTIVEHRDRIERLCTRMPSLQRQLPTMLVEEYPRARRRASVQTRLAVSTFPAQCPWELEQVLDPDFWPDTP